MAATRGCGRTRIWRVGLGAAIFSILLFPQLSASAAQDEALSDREYLGPSPADMQDPAVQAEIASDLNELEQARARRQEPDEIAAREAARTAYQDLTSDQARDLATRLFPELMLNPTWETYEPPEGQRLVRYFGSESALIKPEDSEVGSLVESTAPLRAEDEAGQLRPVDPELVDHGDYLEPANSAVEAELPEQLSDAIELPEAELSVKPEGAVEAASGEVAGQDKVFWANIDTDTDFIATSTPAGVETFWQLRSERSPEQYSLRLDMPPGSSLEPALNGLGAEVVGPEGAEAIVRPPMAFDADGVPVPVEMEPTGNELSLSIAHRSTDFKLPIILDPVVEVVDVWGWGTPCPYGGYSYPFWRWEPEGSPFDPGCSGDWGLVTQTREGTFYPTNAYAQWVWVPPYDTFLERVEFYNTDFTHGNLDDFCSYHGIWSTQAYAWQSLGGSCTPWSHTDLIHQVGQGGHDNNGAVFQLYSPGARIGWQLAWTAVRAAKFVVSDRNNPVFSTPTPPTQPWRDDTIAGTPQSFGYSAAARDGGLGMKWLILRRPDRSAPAGFVVDQRDRGCAGVQGAFPCTAQGGAFARDFSYQLNKLPEGSNTITVTAKDQIDRARTISWQQPIDRSAPTTPALSGSLKTDAAKLWITRDYELSVSATDGVAGPQGTQPASGVAKLEVFVDGEAAPRFETPASGCNAALNSCPMTQTVTWAFEPYDLSAGSHTVRVVATDALGHQAEQEFQAMVRDDFVEPRVTISAGQPDANGNYLLSVTSVDPAPAGSPSGTMRSGVESLEIYLDGELLDTVTQQCPQSGCSLPWSRQMSSSQSLADHEAAVEAYDRAGNSGIEYAGRKDPSGDYNKFGYNEDFTGVAQKAGDGGANILRFPLVWCLIEPSKDNFQWGRAEELLGANGEVATYNAAHSERPIVTIPVVLGAPRWADDNPDNDDKPGCPANTEPPRNSQDRLARWGNFVKEVGQRYRTSGSILAIEAWNEPNLAGFWGGGSQGEFTPQPRRFAKLVNVANDATTVPILPGGLANAERVYETERLTLDDPVPYMRAATDPDTTDPEERIKTGGLHGLSLHLYANKAKRTERANLLVRDRYREFEDGLRVGYAGLDRYITEIGFPAGGTGPGLGYGTEAKQRQRLRSAYRRFAKEPKVKSFIVHRLRDLPVAEDPENPDAATENGRYGVVHHPSEHGGANKRIYCFFAGRVAGLSPVCETESHD